MARVLKQYEVVALADKLPQDRPFTIGEARERGVDHHRCQTLVSWGFLRRREKGIYHSAGLPDSLELRIAILKLLVPSDCVVTDRTAAWLWGADMALAPGDHLEVPRISVFAPPGRRLRNGITSSGERMLAKHDVVELAGLLVTTPLRTACDLLRLLHRDRALAAADSLAALEQFTVADVAAELLRFRGYRGIIQARGLATLIDKRAQSAMESISRLRWHDAGLPLPECQVEVGPFAIDIGLPDERFGLEFYGEECHGEDRTEHDEGRLEWLRTVGEWTMVVARRDNVIGPKQDLEQILRREWAERPRLIIG